MERCIAMVLAGGRGERLGALTRHYSKPAIHFGGRCRIIDFALSNCIHSGIEPVAVLGQHFTPDLNAYVSSIYGGDTGCCGIYLLSSRSESGRYRGTADAVYRNFPFIERYKPEHVLILASDHIYRMDYNPMLAFHAQKEADVTVASIPVSPDEASRFGILRAGEDGHVLAFEEKSKRPCGDLASMGVYAFKWSALREYLRQDSARRHSTHDFGRDILPNMLAGGRFYTYPFDSYWCDVGTVAKLWEANMDLLKDRKSIVSGGCSIYGHVRHSVIGDSVVIGHGAEIVNSVLMSNVCIGGNVKIFNTIVGDHTVIRENTIIGAECGTDFFVDRRVCAGEVSLISPRVYIKAGMVIRKNSHIQKENLEVYYAGKNSNIGPGSENTAV